jgi:hypothetical protein
VVRFTSFTIFSASLPADPSLALLIMSVAFIYSCLLSWRSSVFRFTNASIPLRPGDVRWPGSNHYRRPRHPPSSPPPQWPQSIRRNAIQAPFSPYHLLHPDPASAAFFHTCVHRLRSLTYG